MAIERARPTRQSEDDEQSRGPGRERRTQPVGEERQPRAEEPDRDAEAEARDQGPRRGGRQEAQGRASDDADDRERSAASDATVDPALQEQIDQVLRGVL